MHILTDANCPVLNLGMQEQASKLPFQTLAENLNAPKCDSMHNANQIWRNAWHFLPRLRLLYLLKGGNTRYGWICYFPSAPGAPELREGPDQQLYPDGGGGVRSYGLFPTTLALDILLLPDNSPR